MEYSAGTSIMGYLWLVEKHPGDHSSPYPLLTIAPESTNTYLFIVTQNELI
jgi:hypothetical protein